MVTSNSSRSENGSTPELQSLSTELENAVMSAPPIAEDAVSGNLALPILSPLESNEFNAVASTILQQTQWRSRPSYPVGLSAMWKTLGIKSKVMIAAIALSVMPALGIGTIAYLRASSTVQAQIQADKANRATALTRRLQIYMGFRLAELEDLSTRLIFRDPRVIEQQGQTEITRRLNKFLARSSVYDSLAFFDLNGDVIVQSDGSKLPNIAAESYFQTAIVSGEQTYTNPQDNQEIDEPAIFLAVPIRRLDSAEIIGVVRLRLPQHSLFASVSDIQSDVDDIYVIDRDGKYILAAPAGVAQPDNGDQSPNRNPERNTEQELIGEKLNDAFPGLWNSIEKQPNKTLKAQDSKGQSWLISSSAPIVEQGLLNLQWTGIIETPVADAFRVQRQLLLTLLLGTGATIVASLALALFLSNQTTRPLLNAAKAVKKIGDGDLETRLDVPADGDELVQLGQNINLMGDQLKSFFEQQTMEAQLSQLLGDLARVRDEAELPVRLDQLMHEVQRQTGSDRVIFQRTEGPEGSGVILAEAVLPALPQTMGETIHALSQTDQETYNNQQTLVLSQITQGDVAPDQLQQLQGWGVKSMLATPILLNNKLYGILAFHSCAQERWWTPQDSDFITQMGSRLGLALSSVDSFQQAQHLAHKERKAKEKLQAELLGFLNSVEGASSGDLTVRAQITADEIGIVADFFNAIVESLRDVVTEAKQAADQVNSSVTSSGESIGKLATETLHQSHQVKETLVSVEVMTTALHNVASKAQEAAKTTQQAELTAQAGGKAMDKTVDSIQQVRRTVAETAKKVKRLGESSQQISKVVELINQIALKTNLLAVNAGIEAARAGEEGRGFAVVAEEVGALAAQSATATKEIEQIITSIQTGTTEVVEAMESSTTQVVAGTRSVEEAQSSLAQILAASQQVNEIFQMISQETVEQADTSSLVQNLMKQMAQVTDTASQDSEAVSKLLANTVQVAEQLQTTMSTFKVDRT